MTSRKVRYYIQHQVGTAWKPLPFNNEPKGYSLPEVKPLVKNLRISNFGHKFRVVKTFSTVEITDL